MRMVSVSSVDCHELDTSPHRFHFGRICRTDSGRQWDSASEMLPERSQSPKSCTNQDIDCKNYWRHLYCRWWFGRWKGEFKLLTHATAINVLCTIIWVQRASDNGVYSLYRRDLSHRIICGVLCIHSVIVFIKWPRACIYILT